MTLALLVLMGYHLWGDVLHEWWVGAGMLLLFLAHHILNGHWYKALGKGKYSAMRIVTLCVDTLVLVAMLAQMYSGIVMSRYVFDFLPSGGGMALARRLHILGAYWGYILLSLHLGLHWNMILGLSRKAMGLKGHRKGAQRPLRLPRASSSPDMAYGLGFAGISRLICFFEKRVRVFWITANRSFCFIWTISRLWGFASLSPITAQRRYEKLRKKSEAQ